MQTLLLKDVPDELVERLRLQALRNGREVESELRDIVELGVAEADASRETRRRWMVEAKRLREETRGRSLVPSWVLIREDRDAR